MPQPDRESHLEVGPLSNWVIIVQLSIQMAVEPAETEMSLTSKSIHSELDIVETGATTFAKLERSGSLQVSQNVFGKN